MPRGLKGNGITATKKRLTSKAMREAAKQQFVDVEFAEEIKNRPWRFELPNWDPNRLRQIRVWKGMSQIEFAEFCGLPPTHISDIESGRIKPSIQIVAIVASLGYCANSINWFLNGVKDDDSITDINVFRITQGVKRMDKKGAKFIADLVDNYLNTFGENN